MLYPPSTQRAVIEGQLCFLVSGKMNTRYLSVELLKLVPVEFQNEQQNRVYFDGEEPTIKSTRLPQAVPQPLI